MDDTLRGRRLLRKIQAESARNLREHAENDVESKAILVLGRPKMIICPRCDGGEKDPGVGVKPCPDCLGTGEVPNPEWVDYIASVMQREKRADIQRFGLFAALLLLATLVVYWRVH